MSDTCRVRFFDGPLDGEVRDCELLENAVTTMLKDHHNEYAVSPAYGDFGVWAHAHWRGPLV